MNFFSLPSSLHEFFFGFFPHPTPIPFLMVHPCEDKLKGKTTHFRSPSETQKRRILKLPSD